MRLIESLVDQNRLLLAQGMAEIAALEPPDYVRPLGGLESGIGGHLRHVLEHYGCLLEGLRPGRVCYEARRRDRRLEVDMAAAFAAHARVAAGLEDLRRSRADARLEVWVGDGPEGDWTASTVGRELGFLASHTVHHFALVAVALGELRRRPAAGFGVAPSTLRYRREVQAWPA